MIPDVFGVAYLDVGYTRRFPVAQAEGLEADLDGRDGLGVGGVAQRLAAGGTSLFMVSPVRSKWVSRPRAAAAMAGSALASFAKGPSFDTLIVLLGAQSG